MIYFCQKTKRNKTNIKKEKKHKKIDPKYPKYYQKMNRLAIVDPERCKPKECKLECKKSCPVNKQGSECIVVSPVSSVSKISENLCIGCNICTKKCPMKAIKIIQIPKTTTDHLIHSYGSNMFKLYKLPLMKPGQILGLLGSNGIGKSTVIKILSGLIKPDDLSEKIKGSELQIYFKNSNSNSSGSSNSNSNNIISIKPQYISSKLPGNVKSYITDPIIISSLELGHLLDREISQLSGGELQRFYIAKTLSGNSRVYIFDEFTSFLDIKQRMKSAILIRGTLQDDKYIVCIEHDLCILDYLSDQICILYGSPGAYGIVSMSYPNNEAINNYLNGFIPSENMRFRNYELNFNYSTEEDPKNKDSSHYSYDNNVIEYSNPKNDQNTPNNQNIQNAPNAQNAFKLTIEGGTFNSSDIIVCLGENGTGKTSFIKSLAVKRNVSIKPQHIYPKFEGTVLELLQKKIPNALNHEQFSIDILRPLNISDIYDKVVSNLSGGEIQRVAIAICLGTPADIYLIDEPSAYLDVEQRLLVAKMIKRYIKNIKRPAFIVEHDFIMSTYLADRVIVFEGSPGIETIANRPVELNEGFNRFLKNIDISFRRDPVYNRPRINKKDSTKDKLQKKNENLF
jgi:ATP-binding cassette subfamily E protein 1